jgi:hypothetical protein
VGGQGGGAGSKLTLDKFGDTYYLGWQEGARIDGMSRSVFNLDASKDGKQWVCKYGFETPKSSQYPVFAEYNGSLDVAVT